MLERLGSTNEWGHVLLGLLECAGWTVTRRPTVGDGVLLIVIGHGTSVSAAGDTLTGAAAPLFERVMALRRWQHAA
jgi:hypothetical protein